MNRLVTGLFRPNAKKRKRFVTTMFCPDEQCGHLWKTPRTGGPCPKCGNHNVIPAACWAPAKFGMPKLGMGRVKFTKASECEVVCDDLDCQSRKDCPHSRPHKEIEECQFICGADEPCSRCHPVEEERI